MNVSRVIAKIAGMLSSAKTRSNVVLAREDLLAVVVLAHRDDFADEFQDRVLLRVDLAAVVGRHPDAGEQQDRAEDVDRPVERVEQRGAGEDEDRPQDDRADDPVEEHLPLGQLGHREVREQQGEDEQVVERQAALD
jgi:hypothetical protein